MWISAHSSAIIRRTKYDKIDCSTILKGLTMNKLTTRKEYDEIKAKV